MAETTTDVANQTPLCPNLASDLLLDLSVNFGQTSKMSKITQILGWKISKSGLIFFGFLKISHGPTLGDMVKSGIDLGKQTPLYPNQASDLLWDVSRNFGRPSKSAQNQEIYLSQDFQKFPLGQPLEIWSNRAPTWVNRPPCAQIGPQICSGTFPGILAGLQKWSKSRNFTFGWKWPCFPNVLILGFLGLFWVENDPLVITRLPRGSIWVKNGHKIVIFWSQTQKSGFFCRNSFFFVALFFIGHFWPPWPP